MTDKRPSMNRRLRFATVIVISQILLIALAISWVIHMVIVAVYGAAYFVENNHFILYAEIVAPVLITLFAIYILILQIKRLGERRGTDRDKDSQYK